MTNRDLTLQPEALANLIDEKHRCVLQLHELGNRQLESIDAGDFSQLMKILAGKQRLLNTLNEIEKRLDPFRRQSPDARRWPDAAARDQCAAMSERCDILLREVIAQEQQSESRLMAQRNDAMLRLEGAHGASQACGAYRAQSGSLAGQLNLVSES